MGTYLERVGGNDQMLQDFPTAKIELLALIRAVLHCQVGLEEPVLARMPQYVHHEGRQTVLRRSDNSQESSTMDEASADLIFSREEMRSLTFDQLVARLSQAGAALARQEAGHMFRRLEETAARVGNVTDAKGKPFSKDRVLEALEKVEISFDPTTEEPTGPALVIPRGRVEEYRAEMATWESDSDFRGRWEEIMARKKAEWRARENRRKLVD